MKTHRRVDLLNLLETIDDLLVDAGVLADDNSCIFNAEMVRAILDGRKTAIRRLVKLKYSNTHLTMRTDKYGTRLIERKNEEPGVTVIQNPDGTTTHRLLALVPVAEMTLCDVRHTGFLEANGTVPSSPPTALSTVGPPTLGCG